MSPSSSRQVRRAQARKAGSLAAAVAAIAVVAMLTGCSSSSSGGPPLTGSGYPNVDASNTRYVGGPINSSNVATLASAWTLPITTKSEYGSYSSAPIISGGVIYSQDLESNVQAIDLQTGVLQKLITAFMRKGSAGMTMDDAKQLLSRILNTDFVKYPPSAVKKGVPEKEGERGVVAGVGLGPRPEYWERHSLLFNAKELSASSRFDGSWLTNCNFRPARSTRQG